MTLAMYLVKPVPEPLANAAVARDVATLHLSRHKMNKRSCHCYSRPSTLERVWCRTWAFCMELAPRKPSWQ